jgi:hypothetical protein
MATFPVNAESKYPFDEQSINEETLFLRYSLRQMGRHLRLRDVVYLAARSFWVATLVAALIALAARFWPIPDRHLWTLLPIGVWLVLMVLYVFLPAIPLERVARRLDWELGLKDRLATALEFQPRSALSAGPPNPPEGGTSALPGSSTLFQAPGNQALRQDLLIRQLDDAVHLVRAVNPRDLAWRVSRRPLWWAGGFLLLGLSLILWPNPMDAILAQRAAVRAAVQEEAKAVQEARRDFEAAVDPTSEDRAEAVRALQELIKALSANPGDLEQALADLSAAEAKLKRLQDPAAAARQLAAEQIAAQLSALSQGEASQSSDLGTAGEALMEMAAALGSLDAATQKELAEALENLAAQAAPTDAELAEALLELAAAARNGDVSGVVNAAGVAQGALTQAGQAIEQQAALAALQNALQQGRQALAQAGSGQGQGQGQAQGQGQGQGQGRGQSPGGGGGTTANQLPGATRSGRANAPTKPNRPATVSESETVFAPSSRLPLSSEPDFVAGRQTEAGQTVVREERSPQPGGVGPALVPYSQVYQTYVEAATQSMERERIPPEWKDYVRDYFSQLAPE